MPLGDRSLDVKDSSSPRRERLQKAGPQPSLISLVKAHPSEVLSVIQLLVRHMPKAKVISFICSQFICLVLLHLNKPCF